MRSILPWVRKWGAKVGGWGFLGTGALALTMTGCAFLGTPTSQKVMGSTCATAGASFSALSIAAPLSVQVKALKLAAVLTPACSSTTPASAESAAVVQAMASLTALASPYITAGQTAATGATVS